MTKGRKIKLSNQQKPKKGNQTTKENAAKKEKANSNTMLDLGGNEIEKIAKQIKKNNEMPNIKKLENDVLQSIVGQDEQVKKITTAIYKSISFSNLKSNILVIGPSGTGKTETIKQIAKRLNVPYTIEDATRYTKTGYYGADVEDMVFNLIENANKDLKKAQQGIIVIDEIDKKVSGDLYDVGGNEVLKSLLKIIEGTKIKIFNDFLKREVVDFDTRNITVILLGAFAGLDKIREKRLNKKHLGFVTSEEKNQQEEKYLKDDLIKYGMPEEFIGRIDSIIEMNKLNKKDLALILKKSNLSIFRRYQNELNYKGVRLKFNNKIFEEIAEKSLELDTGARELSNTVNYIFENIIYEVLAYPGKFKTCTLEEGIVEDNTKYKMS